MKAVVMKAGGGAEVVDAEAPSPGPGELLVRMEACGLCGTDIEKMKGEYVASKPVLGHEAVGTISAVGEGVKGFKAGGRVFPHHHVPCYECRLCTRGSETMCEHYRGTNLVPGGFAESFVVPAWNVAKGGVLRIPEGMSFEAASLIEPLGCCVRAVRASGVEMGESVLVVGAGPVGVMNAKLLKTSGAEVLISDVTEWRLSFAERAGAGSAVDARGDVPRTVRDSTGGRGADLALVASGSAAAILQGLKSVRKGGRVCLFGVPPRGTVLDYDISELYNAEQRVFTSYGATDSDTKGALKVLSAAQDSYASLITHRFPLDRFQEAVATATGGGAMKVLLTPK